MIPPQVNGATKFAQEKEVIVPLEFPMIPPQVNGATASAAGRGLRTAVRGWLFPMIPPQVNGATARLTALIFRLTQPSRFQ